MSNVIEIRGLDELIKRMRAYPAELKKGMEITMEAAMLTLWENVPPYPSPPENSTYVRTGTLGRTLGGGMEGGKGGGEPDIYVVREFGAGYEGRFGTNLEYAPYVIGDDTQAAHMGHWWKIGVIAGKSADKINRMFANLGEKMAAFLEGR